MFTEDACKLNEPTIIDETEVGNTNRNLSNPENEVPTTPDTQALQLLENAYLK